MKYTHEDKFIFLDIDGVLNHELIDTLEDDLIDNPNKAYWHLSKSSIAKLNTLTDQTGAKIVISSTWRLTNEWDELVAFLGEVGITGEIVGRTGSCKCGIRGVEIRAWLNGNVEKSHEFSSYVILDDDSDMLLWQQHNYINVDAYCGLSNSNIWKAHKILTGKYPKGYV